MLCFATSEERKLLHVTSVFPLSSSVHANISQSQPEVVECTSASVSSSPPKTTTESFSPGQQLSSPTSKTSFEKPSPQSSSSSSSSSSLRFSETSLLSQAGRVASRLTALLQSPPNESMDSVRDIGSSVDGDSLALALNKAEKENQHDVTEPKERSIKFLPSQPITVSDIGDQVIDRGMDLEEENFYLDRQGENDNEEEDSSELLDNSLDSTGGSESLSPVHSKPFKGAGKTPLLRPDGQKPTLQQQTHKRASNDSNSYESPDSDTVSEEGVFVNMMDDLDTNSEDKSATVSEASDDTCVSADSMFLSPDEKDVEEEVTDQPVRKMSLQEAISRAASDLSRMSLDMYGVEPSNSNNDDIESGSAVAPTSLDSGESSSTAKLVTVGRGSPVRSSSGLKITISSDSRSSPTILSESPVYAEDEFNFNRVTLRKSSSLKTNKTPPGTPHRKKVVRFADAMGLDLESVRHVLNTESPPKIPASAMADLQTGLNEDRKEIGSKYLCPCFNQPGASDDFFLKIQKEKVSLENAMITDLTITGFVRVANISFHKSVRIRYTHNSWATFHDIAASYVQNSCDGPTDRFSFSIVAPAYFVPGHRLEFAINFNAGGVEYWDNNGGKNYVFECFAKTVPLESESSWMHFL